MARVIRHRKIAGGAQEAARDVSRNEWNDGHAVGWNGPFEAFTDCLLVASNTLDGQFLAQAYGAGGAVLALNSTDPALQGGAAMGVVEFATGAASNTVGAAGWGLGPGSVTNGAQASYVGLSDLAAGERLRFGARLRMPTLLSGGDDTLWRAGFANNFLSTAQCALVEWNPPLFGDNDLRLRTAAGGASGLAPLGFSVFPGDWFAVEVEVGAGALGARARVNGGAWVPGVGDLPTARTNAGGIVSKTGAVAHAQSRRLQLDWCGTVWPLAAVRGYA